MILAMSLQTTVRGAMIGAALGSALAVASMAGAYRMLERAQLAMDFAGTLNADVGKLNLLTTELAVQRSTRPQYQWNRQFEIIYAELQQPPDYDRRIAVLAQEILKRLDTMKQLVDRLGVLVQRDEARSQDARELLFSSVIAHAGGILSRTREVHAILSQAGSRTRSQVFLVIGVGAIAVIIGGSLLLLSLSNGLLARILKLRSVIQEISHGNLEAAVPARTPDEMGDVFHELDQMRVSLLQSMSELSRVNLELIGTKAQLEDNVAQRTAKLESVNRDLESFTYAVSHDLRAPLRAISGFSRVVLDDYGDAIDDYGKNLLERVVRATQQMNQLIEDLLTISKLDKRPLAPTMVNLSRLAEEIGAAIRERTPGRDVVFTVEPGVFAQCDERTISVALTNLLENAWKFSAGKPHATIAFGRCLDAGPPTFFIRDNGAGFDPAFSDRLFKPFHRLHSASEFTGTGIGLATVARVAQLHDGKVWAQSSPGEGATFYIQLGALVPDEAAEADGQAAGSDESNAAEASQRRAG
jgi:signal transduction histidine kinase